MMSQISRARFVCGIGTTKDKGVAESKKACMPRACRCSMIAAGIAVS